jgi:hypothetical protein
LELGARVFNEIEQFDLQFLIEVTLLKYGVVNLEIESVSTVVLAPCLHFTSDFGPWEIFVVNGLSCGEVNVWAQ